MPAPPPPPSPAVRRFRLYSSLVFSFAWVPVMYTAFTHDRGFTPDAYLTLWAVYYLAMVAAEVPFGWLADRVGPKPLLVLGPLVLAGAFVVLGHADAFATCLGAMAVTGAAHAMISGADSSYLYELVCREGRRAEALREETTAHRWRLFGVSVLDVVGGLVAFAVGTAFAFDLSAVVVLGAAALAAGLPTTAPTRSSSGSLRAEAATLLAALRQPGVLWVLGWYAAVFVLLRIGFQLYQPTLLALHTDDLRLHGGLLGALNLVAGCAALLVGPIHAAWRERGTCCAVLWMLAASFAGLAWTVGSSLPTLWLLPLLCLQQVSFGFLQPVGRTSLNHRIPSGDRTAVLSAQSMLARLGFGLLLALGSWDEALAADLGSTYASLACLSLGLAALAWASHSRLAGPGVDGA